MLLPHLNSLRLMRNVCDHAVFAAVHNAPVDRTELPEPSAHRDSGAAAACDHRADGTQTNADADYALAPSSTKLITVAPCSEFRPHRLANAHQLETFPESREPDVLGGN